MVGCQPFREFRRIISASSFIEELCDKSTYHKIELDRQAIAFGGLYQDYVDLETGEAAIGTIISPVPPPTQETGTHPESMPLILSREPHVLDAWLDPNSQNVDQFEWLLQP
ncbi:MAG: hypothetical protein WEB57_10280 [Pseudohongiellaceae bacterium]